jgi:predicted ATPase
LAARRARETEANLPYYLALLAEVYRKAGQAEEALSTLAEALEAAHKTGERFYEAELYRLKGELTLQQSRTSLGQISGKSRPVRRHRPLIPDLQAEAEGCFLKAIDLARRQQAKSLELRAVMSLARLWQSPRKHHEARNMLIEIYGWFTEGFDTKDLREAKALLEELHH